jgi:lipopolysaccharide transport system permease protein
MSLQPRHIELICYKAYASLRAETTKTYVGFLWWIFDPILFMAIFYLVFGLLLQRGTEDFVTFLLVGLVSWRWFQNSISNGAAAILNGQQLMRQVYLPKLVFPLVAILMDVFKFALVLALLLVYLWLRDYPIGMAYLALPILLAVQLLLTAALTCLVAALVPMLPDLRYLVTHILQVMLFTSGIFYSGEMIPENFQPYFYLNPMANLIEDFRAVLMHGLWPHWAALVKIALFSVLLLMVAWTIIARYDYEYPKMIAR